MVLNVLRQNRSETYSYTDDLISKNLLSLGFQIGLDYRQVEQIKGY